MDVGRFPCVWVFLGGVQNEENTNMVSFGSRTYVGVGNLFMILDTIMISGPFFVLRVLYTHTHTPPPPSRVLHI